MKITITTLTDFIFTLEVSEDMELENFKVFCEVESGFPAQQIVISFNGVLLSDEKKSLKDYGIVDGDVVVLQHMLQGRQGQGARPRLNPTSTGRSCRLRSLPICFFFSFV